MQLQFLQSSFAEQEKQWGRAGKGHRDTAQQHPGETSHLQPPRFADHPDHGGGSPNGQVARQGSRCRIGIGLGDEVSQIKAPPMAADVIDVGQPGRHSACDGQRQVEPLDGRKAWTSVGCGGRCGRHGRF